MEYTKVESMIYLEHFEELSSEIWVLLHSEGNVYKHCALSCKEFLPITGAHTALTYVNYHTIGLPLNSE